MKKEVLRIQNLNIPYQEGKRFRWVSMILFEGECTAFLGLSFSGKDDLVRMLTSRRSVSAEELNLFIDSERVRTQKQLERSVYRILPRSRAVPGWTCAEYIALRGAGWVLMGAQKRELLAAAQETVDELGIALDVRRGLSTLSDKERRLAELARACALGARVLVIEDELEGLTEEEILELAGILRRTARKKHFTVIINAHSPEVFRVLASHYVIFRDGRIIKKCQKGDITSAQQLEDYMLGPMTASRRDLETISPAGSGGREETGERIVYRMRNYPSGGHLLRALKGSGLFQQSGGLLDFTFRRSSVTTFLVLDEKQRTSLFLSLSGRELSGQTYCVIGEKRLEYGMYPKFVESRIVSVMHLGSREELFGNMSVGENLVLPSIRKISFSDYLFSSGRLTNALDRSAAIPESFSDPLEESGVNDRIAITLERWYLYNPKVLILLEPFERCDLYGVSIVRSYIRRMASRGACVIIIKSRAEYAEDISDEILRFF